MTHKKNETQKIFFSAPMAILRFPLPPRQLSTTLVLLRWFVKMLNCDLFCQNIWFKLIIILSKYSIVINHHFHIVEAASHILQLVWDGCWVFPFRRTDLRDEVWQLDLWWVSGKDDARGNDGQGTGVWPPWFRRFMKACQQNQNYNGEIWLHVNSKLELL